MKSDLAGKSWLQLGLCEEGPRRGNPILVFAGSVVDSSFRTFFCRKNSTQSSRMPAMLLERPRSLKIRSKRSCDIATSMAGREPDIKLGPEVMS